MSGELLNHKNLIIGISKGLDIPLWYAWKGIILWHIWIKRNQVLFNSLDNSSLYSLVKELRRLASSYLSKARDAPTSKDPFDVHHSFR